MLSARRAFSSGLNREPVTVTIEGAASQIGYQLCFKIASYVAFLIGYVLL